MRAGAFVLAALITALPSVVHAAGGPNEVTSLTLDFSRDAEWTEPAVCMAHGWKDYLLEISPEQAGNNVLFEVEDLNPATEGYKINAMSVRMFKDKIPANRKSAASTDMAYDRLYSIGIDALHMTAGSVYISIMGGPTDTTYRVRARAIAAEVGLGVVTYGEVCPATWVYHKITITAEDITRDGDELSVAAIADGYGFYALSLRQDMPREISSPFSLVEATDYSTMTTCSVQPGTYYLPIYGHDHCASYNVTTTLAQTAVCEAT
eukprot:COSAG06_NODE_19401_length_840_cov_0.967611_1_plen_263_part_01